MTAPSCLVPRYRVALSDRLEDVSDHQLAPNLAEGEPLVFLAARGGPSPATTVLMDDMSW